MKSSFAFLIRAVMVVPFLVEFLSTPVFADEVADVRMLLRSKQYADALRKADSFLARSPRDPQMQFMKGMIFAEQSQTDEAIAVYSKLVEDYPVLPEPYNNLAVLYAAKGQYEKARANFEKATVIKPDYSTAHENLGDIYAHLAIQAYDRALDSNSSTTNANAKAKINLVQTLIENVAENGAQKSIITPVSRETAKNVAALNFSDPIPSKPEMEKIIPQTPSRSVPEKEVIVQQEKRAQKNAPISAAEREEVLKVIDNWVKAWSAKNVDAYLSFYGSDFQVPDGLQRKAWEQKRRSRIEEKGFIKVKVEDIDARVKEETATVKFRQRYASARVKDKSSKTLILEKDGGKWLIIQERSSNS